MRTRGRPPHPDILTPREWEVLALLDAGLTNEQIAGRLGISVNGAKFHVSQILTKLGVANRSEAPSIAYANRGRRIRRWAIFPLLKLGAAKTNSAAAGGLVVAVAAVLLLLLLALRGQAAAPFDAYAGIYVLDVSSGKVLRAVDLRSGFTRGFEWTADSAGFVVSRYEADRGSFLQRYDRRTGALRAEDSLQAGSLKFALLDDGRFGVVHQAQLKEGVFGTPPSGAAVLDPDTLALLEFVEIPTDVSQASWRPDGSAVALFAGIGVAKPYDYSPAVVWLDGRRPRRLEAPLVWSPDGTLYATPTLSGSIEIRDTMSDKVLNTLSAA